MRRREFLTSVASSTLLASSAICADDNHAFLAQLRRHRVKRFETSHVQLDWPRQVGKNSRGGVHGRGNRPLICRLVTDRDAAGWGIVRGNRKTAEAAFAQAEGKPLAEIFNPAIGIVRDEFAPLDFALHDLAGIVLDLPVYQMLGAAGPQATDCYSGMIYFDDLEPADKPAGIEKVLQNCRSDIDRGYRQLKVKIGRGNKWMPKPQGLARDIEVTRQIARSFPQVRILVDGNNGFSLDEFIQYLEGINDVSLFWIEEPFHENVEDYAQLREWLSERNRKTYLADGEASPDWQVLDELFDKQILDVQLVDVVGYGYTAWRKLLTLLKHQGQLSSPHAWGNALKTNYTAHLAAGIGGVLTIEGVTCQSKDVDLSGYKLASGKLTVSQAPGFGMTLKS